MKHRYYYQKLHPSLRGVYDSFYHALSCRAARFDGQALTPPQINELLHLILLDHPQLCHFEGKWGYSNGIVPIYTLTLQQTQALSAAVAELLRSLPIPAPSDSQTTVRIIYDWFLSHVAYDPYAPRSQSSYGALVERRAACKGISKGFQLLLHTLDIPCILVEGTLDDQMKHVWNMVNINGQWTHVDICMGYPLFYSLTNAKDPYSCFCVSTQTLQNSHRIHHSHLLPTEVPI